MISVVALVAAVVVAAVVLLGGGGGATYRVVLPNAGQLVDGNEVQIGGRRVGLVSEIGITDDLRAEVRFRIDDDAALPLHEGTTAAVRAVSMSGIANRVVSVSPGPNSAPALADGATLDADDVTPAVDLDQLFDSFDPATRRGFQRLFRGGSRTLAGRERDANRSLRYLPTMLQSSGRLFDELARDQQTLDRFLVSGARVVGALAAERDSLTGAVSHTRATMAAMADEGAALERSLDRLPGSLGRASTTFADVRRTLDRLDPLVAASKPAAAKTPPLLRDLRPLVADLVPTVSGLRRLARDRGPDDDLVELLRATPPLADAATPALRNGRRAAAASRPVAGFIRPYAPEIVGWARTFSGATASYDANGHVARTQGIFNGNTVTDSKLLGDSLRRLLGLTGPLTGLYSDDNRAVRRCPGANAQTLPDRSNPFRDADGTLDCDPKAVLPGS
ncbi:MlaD family protein [Patulibacter defluvii]|uniref:MlaD family protein n=1 Tax=Patulibacter defluvii TaxID=3095358 RepID=UPI002A74EBB7|nr:MlaD family protein [Patulibacter sp. DM4]